MKLAERQFPDTAAIWSETLDYFERLGIYHVRDIIPYYLCSFGAHVANLANKQPGRSKVFYTRAGTVPDLRLHLYLVGPPGFGRSFFSRLFFAGGMKADPKDKTSTGIATTFDNYELGNITSIAPVIGSLIAAGKDDEGKYKFKEQKGLAKLYPYHILWAEEFGSIRDTMRSQMGVGLLDAFLKLLDDGEAERNMLGGRIEVKCFSTFWLGTQTERIDMPSGLARRGLFVDTIPSMKDIQAYNDAWENTENIKPEWDTINELRSQYKTLFQKFRIKGQLRFSSKYLKYRRSLRIVHTDKEILNRLAIGYAVMNNYEQDNGGSLTVDLTPELKDLIERAIVMKFSVLGQTGYQQIIEFIKEKDWELHELVLQCVAMHMSYKNGRQKIQELKKMGVLKFKLTKKDGSKKPTTIVSYSQALEDIDWTEEKE